RAQRIRDLLTSQDHQLTLADMAKIQADYYSLPATEIVPYITKVQPETPLAASALKLLCSWNYILAANSAGAAIYMTFLRKLQRIVLGALIGDDEQLLNSYLGVGSTLIAMLNGYAGRSKPLLIRLLREHDDSWFANPTIPNGPRSWNEALTRAFHAAIEELDEKLGHDPARWQYGSIHQMTYRHPLGLVKPLNKFFNRGPFPVGGDIDTVNMGTVSPAQPTEVITVPSYRQIVNLADLPSSLSGHSPGQSGHQVSKHYDDFIKMWLQVSHHPMLFTRQAVEDNAEGTLLIKPK
ncbi:MAG TPA: penicillin acylase family protein, partial [Ktedonobacteraceae bacterium]|nr:penicillin acylase family protein [Ktedonobacteraceae bacterium]